MSTIRILIIIVLLMLVLDLIIIVKIIIHKINFKNNIAISNNKIDNFINYILGKSRYRKNKFITKSYFEIKQNIILRKNEKIRAEKYLNIEKLERNYTRKIKSLNKTKRIESITNLCTIGTDSARKILEDQLKKEKNHVVKLYLANALADIGNENSIPILVNSLLGENHFYRDRVNFLISSFGQNFNNFLSKIIQSPRVEIVELIIDFATVYFSKETKNYLVELIETREESISIIRRIYGRRNNKSAKYEKKFRQLIMKACDILIKFYPYVLTCEKFLFSDDIEIRNKAILSLSNTPSKIRISEYIVFLKDDDTIKVATTTLNNIINKNPKYINFVVNCFMLISDITIRRELAKILSSKLEYFIMTLYKENNVVAKEIIKETLYLNINSEIIDFLNRNKNIVIENELIAIIKEVSEKSLLLQIELSKYLNNRLVIKCGLKPYKKDADIKMEKRDRKLAFILYLITFFSVFIAPIIFIIFHRKEIFIISLIQNLKMFIMEFNYYVAFYSITLSSIYILLMILSMVNVRRQLKLWKIKNKSFLFKNKMLPSVSIIAPAFNEERTIIESTNSLLNLKYPDYELVIVNDGSKDNTLDVLISYFRLSRVNYNFSARLESKQVHGIYVNPSIPKLIVVDKENGGKADSLNTGINISRKSYFCGIDADSLLEEEALLKLASIVLDTGIETPALGGNIIPINGCLVDRGQLVHKTIPENSLARFQTIEYIRAFMAGRLGWAYMNSLLIISGAFGLFNKERVIEVGGYLSSSGKYEKNTVGEDMELVVRISRFMKRKNILHKICYGFNANCWTEVPEDIKTLKKQRYRWHKGLIDILIFHKKMIFNPIYGRIGIIAMPYFLIFEMLGPIIEAEGLIMVIFATMLGLLNNEIALLLFIGTILMGILISLSSLILAEKDIIYFSVNDILILIGYAILENFGPRQLISFWRVKAFFQMLHKQGGWDKTDRKGFINTK